MKERYQGAEGTKDLAAVMFVAAMTVFAIIGALVTAPVRR